jgi:hypothetical protein
MKIINGLLIFFIIILLPGCEKKALERDDYSLVFKNYLTEDTIPFNLSKMFSPLTTDSFDIKLLDRCKGDTLKNEKFEYFYSKYSLFIYDFEKENSLYGDYYDRPFKMPLYERPSLIALGKINIHKDIVGIMVYLKTRKHATMTTGEEYYTLIMFVLKKNKICSIVELSKFSVKGDDKSDWVRTYKTRKDCLTQIYFYGMSDFESPCCNVDDEKWWSKKSMNDLMKKLGIKHERRILGFSMFYIDEIGFVRFISTIGAERSQLPEILTDKYNWKTLHYHGILL